MSHSDLNDSAPVGRTSTQFPQYTHAEQRRGAVVADTFGERVRAATVERVAHTVHRIRSTARLLNFRNGSYRSAS
ncbi:hypothetical protein ACFQ9Z_09135 [Streptomyces sp. NPDC056580]|uniref:hypothetical protein n=1 Tax=Streptomyces sp. NPDC056580 TaxID=3345872 RepID=UPI003695D651